MYNQIIKHYSECPRLPHVDFRQVPFCAQYGVYSCPERRYYWFYTFQGAYEFKKDTTRLFSVRGDTLVKHNPDKYIVLFYL